MITHPTTATPSVHRPETLSEALDLLRDDSSEALAGGTWIMRGEIRGDGFSPSYVLVSQIPELNRLERSDDRLVIGAGVTHDRLATALNGDPRFDGLRTAARKSANPAVRRMATVGGNLSTSAFPAADLVPALIAVSAEVSMAGPDGPLSLPVEDFLRLRGSFGGSLVTHVTVPVPAGPTVHERLTMRRAGDYPIAIAHVHAALDDDGIVRDAAVGLGSVERTPRLWPGLSAALVGSPLDAEAARSAAGERLDELEARDGIEAAGSYRLQVLPALVRNAVRALLRRTELA